MVIKNWDNFRKILGKSKENCGIFLAKNCKGILKKFWENFEEMLTDVSENLKIFWIISRLI